MEVELEGGYLLSAGLLLVENQRLSDYLQGAPPFVPLQRAQLWPREKELGDVVVVGVGEVGDVVVVGVEYGHGKRRDVLSDYTFAIRDEEHDNRLLTVGKAYSGLTDVEIAQLTGARYFRATNEAALDSIYHQIDELEKSTVEVRRYRSRSNTSPRSNGCIAPTSAWRIRSCSRPLVGC